MLVSKKLLKTFLSLSIGAVLWNSCTRSDITFGNLPENGYTQLIFTDTVNVSLSTLVADSFPTSNTSTFLMGKYTDPLLGTVSGYPYCQLTIPSLLSEIPASAVFDSMVMILPTNKYYYGDTTKTQTIQVHELAAPITTSYNDLLYNTSHVAIKSTLLGSATLAIRPTATDSITIRLSNEKGQELFTKLQQKANEVLSEENFLNYFYGIRLSMSENDSAALYGVNAGTIKMRVYYHTTLPLPENYFADFTSLANEYTFNQLISSRPASLMPGPASIKEINTSLSGNHAFTQNGTGLYLKMKFPTLRNIIADPAIQKLLKAELYLFPSKTGYSKAAYPLPSSVYLVTTDKTNNFGSNVLDSSLQETQYAIPVSDDLYGGNTFYRFNLTSYISSLMFTAGTEEAGFIIRTADSVLSTSRLALEQPIKNNQGATLRLTLLKLNKE